MSDKNVYYSPEAFGLKQVEEVELGGGYEFDTFVVWVRVDGPPNDYLWAADNGCSCPTPFDDVDLRSLEHGPLDRLNDAYRTWRDEHTYGAKPPTTLDLALTSTPD